MSYLIESVQKRRIDETEIRTIPIIMFKPNFTFLYFVGRKKLNKITVVYKKAKNNSTFVISPTTLSIIVPLIIIKRNSIFSKTNNIFNDIKEYLINMINTYYKKEMQNAR